MTITLICLAGVLIGIVLHAFFIQGRIATMSSTSENLTGLNQFTIGLAKFMFKMYSYKNQFQIPYDDVDNTLALYENLM